MEYVTIAVLYVLIVLWVVYHERRPVQAQAQPENDSVDRVVREELFGPVLRRLEAGRMIIVEKEAVDVEDGTSVPIPADLMDLAKTAVSRAESHFWDECLRKWESGEFKVAQRSRSNFHTDYAFFPVNHVFQQGASRIAEGVVSPHDYCDFKGLVAPDHVAQVIEARINKQKKLKQAAAARQLLKGNQA